MAVTIKDVAKETNLAISTISKYMNGGNVRPQNRKVIEEAVRRLGYHPNDIARGLRSTKTRNVGILISDFDRYSVEVLSGVEKELRAKGYFAIICSHRDSSEKAKNALKFLMAKRIDGIIVDGKLTSEEYIRPVLDQRIPVVGMETVKDKLRMDYVMTDSVAGSYQAVEDLVKNGHTRIGIITGPKGYFTAEERIRGYRRVYEDYQIEVDERYIIGGDYSFQSGYDGMIKLWELENRPTAVFISNYTMCVGAVSAIHHLKIQIPEELSLTTFDDMEFSVAVKPHLSSFRQPQQDMGAKAAELLIRRMNGEYDDFPKRIRLKGTYIPRDSVKRIASDYQLGE
ncbi:MAG: LacI family DNA-binding transcriptional regulator [Lachnospiraceae bacterium]|nr:LacI family DNA-binding transcriptional regulator [Lachnospiraceae bacterium]